MPSLHHRLRRRIFYAQDAAAAHEQGGWRRRRRRRRPPIASAARLFARLDGDRWRRGGDHRAAARLDTRRRDGARRARRLFGAQSYRLGGGAHVDRRRLPLRLWRADRRRAQLARVAAARQADLLCVGSCRELQPLKRHFSGAYLTHILVIWRYLAYFYKAVVFTSVTQLVSGVL